MADATQKPDAGVLRWTLGDRVVTALCDGYLAATLDLVQNLPAGEAERLQREAFRPVPPRITLNAFLVEGGPDGPILIDAGMGGGAGPTLGHMVEGLAAIGVAPDSIGTVLLTHLHPDHVGGLTTGGQAEFRNAALHVSEAEAVHWLDGDAASRGAPPAAQPYFDGAKASVAPYGERLHRFPGRGEVAPGITAIPLPGHTPGHTGFKLETGGHSLLFWGDIVHLPGIQFAAPAAGVAFDADGAQAVETRRRIFERCAADRQLVAGMHLEFPALGYVVRASEGYRWVPELWVSAT